MVDLSAPTGWRPLPPFPWRAHTRSFVSDEPEGQRIRVAMYVREGELLARVWFGPLAEGPPGHAHGGALAAVHDEAMGYCAHHNGHTVLAANLDIRYRAATPLLQPLTLRASIHQVSGRKVIARSRMFVDERHVLSEGEGLFVAIPEERFAGLVKAPR